MPLSFDLTRKMIQVVPTISEPADGVGTFVRNLCDSMWAASGSVRLATLEWSSISEPPVYLKTFPIGFGLRRLGTSPQMKKWLSSQAGSGDLLLIHNHGMWMMPSIYAGNICKKTRCKMILSPHGTMSQWALNRQRGLKRIFWELLQKSSVNAASCFHATSVSEFEDIRRLGFKQPVCILPCGVEIWPYRKKLGGTRKKLLFLGRIHPVKGVNILLQAWQAIEDKFPDWDLHIVGSGDSSYVAEMQLLKHKLLLQRVSFDGPISGDEKLRAYREADIYVLPSLSENFGITIAEALSAGTPVIVTKGTPWAGLSERGAGWWIELGVAPLVACLEQALALSPLRLAEMGGNGHQWMNNEFAWDHIASKFLVTYRWLLDGGVAPPWVRLD